MLVVDGLGLSRHGAKTVFFWDFHSLVVSVLSGEDEGDLALEAARNRAYSFGANYSDSSGSEYDTPEGFPYWEEPSTFEGTEPLGAPLGGGGGPGGLLPGRAPCPLSRLMSWWMLEH